MQSRRCQGYPPGDEDPHLLGKAPCDERLLRATKAPSRVGDPEIERWREQQELTETLTAPFATPTNFRGSRSLRHQTGKYTGIRSDCGLWCGCILSALHGEECADISSTNLSDIHAMVPNGNFSVFDLEVTKYPCSTL